MNEKEMFLKLRKLIKENALLNKDALIKEKEELLNDLVIYRNDLRNHDISSFSKEIQDINDFYKKKIDKKILALLFGIPALLTLTCFSNVFGYLLFIYVVVNCVMIKINEADKLRELEKYDELKEYIELRKAYNERVLRTDILNIEMGINSTNRKLNKVNKKLELYRLNDLEIKRIQKTLFNYEEVEEKEKILIK